MAKKSEDRSQKSEVWREVPHELNPTHTKIRFEDHGQDFLEWVIEDLGGGLGKVIECSPFQNSIWSKMYVLNYDELDIDVRPQVSESPAHEVFRMNYSINEITFLRKEAANG